jgi:hypothetical protein
MNGKQRKLVVERVEQEGFDYAFAHYTNFEEVTDPEFHHLREVYLASRIALINYVGLEDC